MIGSYYQAQLASLLGFVREGFADLDRGRIDEFELDDVIRHYIRSAAALWQFCGSSGAERQHAAVTLGEMRARGEDPDWWAAGEQVPAT
jgi:hypothetical protein